MVKRKIFLFTTSIGKSKLYLVIFNRFAEYRPIRFILAILPYFSTLI
nr:MAG TPA: hypothetical protein [Caudoviricetes sp.]